MAAATAVMSSGGGGSGQKIRGGDGPTLVPIAHPIMGVTLHMDSGVSVEDKMDELHGIIRETMQTVGLLIFTGLHELSASQMVRMMEALGEREEMADWSSMPIDPEDDGKEGEGVPTVEAPGEPRVRVLGTAVNEQTGKPLSLRADIGYEWYVQPYTHTQKETNRERGCVCVCLSLVCIIFVFTVD